MTDLGEVDDAVGEADGTPTQIIQFKQSLLHINSHHMQFKWIYTIPLLFLPKRDFMY
jgi:hypothetical protein